jgi:hypothetical protein
MDPVSLIVAALAAGASSGLTDAAGQVVRDAYGGLKSLLRRKLSKEPLAQDVIDKYQETPDVWERPLREKLDKAGVAADTELIEAAQELLALIDPDGTRGGKYSVHISGGKGIVVGDHAKVEMTFEDGD